MAEGADNSYSRDIGPAEMLAEITEDEMISLLIASDSYIVIKVDPMGWGILPPYFIFHIAW